MGFVTFCSARRFATPLSSSFVASCSFCRPLILKIYTRATIDESNMMERTTYASS
jgi:hypothetical protein